jgi:hypothetical protein
VVVAVTVTVVVLPRVNDGCDTEQVPAGIDPLHDRLTV